MSGAVRFVELVLDVRWPRRRPEPRTLADDFQQSMDRVQEVLSTGPAEVEELRSKAKRMGDPLQRHLLCRATGLHDPRPDGTCRDCEAVAGDAPVCAEAPAGSRPAPDRSEP